jgi:GNAT superfamily N-acetyltransferase
MRPIVPVQIEFLIDHKEAAPVVSDWLFDEWGHLAPQLTRANHLAEMMSALSRDCVPVHLLALANETPCGTATLKLHEMLKVYPDWKYWLGNVFVRSESRGEGIATLLCQHIESVARTLSVGKLHLQTERLDGGLYSRLGFRRIEQVHYNGRDVLVMAKNL